MRKLRKIVSLIAGVVVIGVVMAGCSSEERSETPNIRIEEEKGSSGEVGRQAKEQTIRSKYAWSADGEYTGRTRIVDGQLVEWGEEYPMDKNNKPIRYEATSNSVGTPIHSIYYNVDGQELEVVVNEETSGNFAGQRAFYDSTGDNFAIIGKGVEKSNEAVLRSVAANRRLNEEVEKYR